MAERHRAPRGSFVLWGIMSMVNVVEGRSPLAVEMEVVSVQVLKCLPQGPSKCDPNDLSCIPFAKHSPGDI